MKYFFNLDSAVKNQNQGTGFWFATNVSIISTMPSASLVVLGKKKKAYRVFCEGDHQQDSQRRRIIRNRFLFYATRLLLGIAKSELFSNHFFQCCTHVKMFQALFQIITNSLRQTCTGLIIVIVILKSSFNVFSVNAPTSMSGHNKKITTMGITGMMMHNVLIQ